MSDPQPPIAPPSAVIQALCQEVDRLLASNFAPWRCYAQWQEQRQLLQRLRDALLLQPDRARSSPPPLDSTSQLVVDTLQTDIRQLLQTRQQLQQEVVQLTTQRDRQQALVMQPLIAQVEQLELFQTRTNGMLQDVDRTLALTLRTVGQDITAYEQALTQRLSKLDDLSQQSETIVATLFQQLLQEIQQLRLAAPEVAPVPAPLVSLADVAARDPIALDATPTMALPTVSPISQLSEILPWLGLSLPESTLPESMGWATAVTELDAAITPTERVVSRLNSPGTADPRSAVAAADDSVADDYVLDIDDL